MIRFFTLMFGLLLAYLAPLAPLLASEISRPDDHAPIGVMGDHNHHRGEWMFSYRYSRVEMDGNRSGTDKVSTGNVPGAFMVAPLDMSMEMHMLGVMYGVSDRLTLMGMASHISKTMAHVNRIGTHFDAHSEGTGDLKVMGLYTLMTSEQSGRRHKVLLNLGLSLPRGSTDERDDTPAGPNQKLPYPMQLGSGTVDPILGITSLHRHQTWSWGAQALSTLRFGKNDQGYRLGNEYTLTGWLAKALCPSTSLSFRIQGSTWGDIEGSDGDLTPAMVPTARTDLRGGERIDGIVGINLYKPDPPTNHRSQSRTSRLIPCIRGREANAESVQRLGPMPATDIGPCFSTRFCLSGESSLTRG